MTSFSVVVAFAIALLLSLVLSWSLQRWFRTAEAGTDSFASNREVVATLTLIITAMVSLPAMTSNSFGDLQQLFRPSEALDWLPAAMSAIGLVSLIGFHFKLHSFWSFILAVAICSALCFRMMWGSIYLQPAELNFKSLVVIATWAIVMASCWQMGLWRHPSVSSKHRWFEGIAWGLTIAIAAVCLGMTGSVLYAVAGAIFALITLGTLIANRQITTALAVPSLTVIGLGYAFSELSIFVTTSLILAVLTLSISRLFGGTAIQLSFLGLAFLLAMFTVVKVGIAFNQQSHSSDNAYDAYK